MFKGCSVEDLAAWEDLQRQNPAVCYKVGGNSTRQLLTDSILSYSLCSVRQTLNGTGSGIGSGTGSGTGSRTGSGTGLGTESGTGSGTDKGQY